MNLTAEHFRFLTMSLYPLFTGPLRIERHTLTIRDLPLRLRGMRVAQLSDFHYDGLRLDDTLLGTAIAACNALEPDLVCLTGDFITADPSPAIALAAQLAQLRSTYGCYAVLGNHDLLRSGARQYVTQALEAVGITVLWNEAVYPCGPELSVIGLADFWSPQFDPEQAFAGVDPLRSCLVLSHNPDSAAVLRDRRVDLQLSGHSHGGQIRLPGGEALFYYWDRLYDCGAKLGWGFRRDRLPGASLLRILKHWEWSAGLSQIGPNFSLYVNRGLGTYPPGRYFCPPELTLLTLM